MSRALWRIVPVIGLLCISLNASAVGSDYGRVAGGVVIYFGITPAQIVEGQPARHPASAMRGDAPIGANHIVMSLFDEKSSERITSAEVAARVAAGRELDVQKRIEPMSIVGSASYSNFFYMPRGRPLPDPLENSPAGAGTGGPGEL